MRKYGDNGHREDAPHFISLGCVLIVFIESEDIWEKPAAVDEEKTKEQEFDEYFEDLFM